MCKPIIPQPKRQNTSRVQIHIYDTEELKFKLEKLEWNSEIQSKIHAEMHRKNLTQRELGERMNMRQQRVNDLINTELKHKGYVVLKYLLAFSSALGCTMEYLIGLVENPTDILITNTGYSIWNSSISYLPENVQEEILVTYDDLVEKQIIPCRYKEKSFLAERHYCLEELESDANCSSIDLHETKDSQEFKVGYTSAGMFMWKDEHSPVYFVSAEGEKRGKLCTVKDPIFHYLIPGNLLDNSVPKNPDDIGSLMLLPAALLMNAMHLSNELKKTINLFIEALYLANQAKDFPALDDFFKQYIDQRIAQQPKGSYAKRVETGRKSKYRKDPL